MKTPGGFQEWLLRLPDLVAAAREAGTPIVADDPGTEHGRALLGTLGVYVDAGGGVWLELDPEGRAVAVHHSTRRPDPAIAAAAELEVDRAREADLEPDDQLRRG